MPKKLSAICLCIIMIFSAALLSSCIFSEKIRISEDLQSSIKFIYNDKNINTQMDKEDSDAVVDIFNNKECFTDNPSCGFDGNISLTFGTDTFMVACDGCSIIKHNNKYFNVSDSEIRQIHRIMRKYGARFPCV